MDNKRRFVVYRGTSMIEGWPEKIHQAQLVPMYVDISILRSGSHQSETWLALHEGRSGVFALSDRATRLLLLRDGVAVREVPLLLTPGQTTLVQ